jgi:hypothetical protein
MKPRPQIGPEAMIRSSDRKQFVRIMRWDKDGTQPIDDRKLAQRVIPQPVKGVLHPRLTGRNFKLTHYSWLGWLAAGCFAGVRITRSTRRLSWRPLAVSLLAEG